MSGVTAVVVGERRDVAIAREQVAAVLELASLAEVADAARGARTPQLWILDSRSAPTAQTLPALLDAGQQPAASLPLDDRGDPVEAALGRFVEDDVGALLDAAARRRVPLRHARVVSLLVARDAVAGLHPPDPRRYGAYAGNEWTSRLFARFPGILVPESTVRLEALDPGRPLHAVRAAHARGWGKGETLRELQRTLVG